jgi:hypothetical protein
MRKITILFMLSSLMVMATGACGNAAANQSTVATNPTSPRADPIQISMRSVEATINEVNLAVAIANSTDISMAWEDLSSDVLSSLRDLARDPTSVDVAGVGKRIANFEEQFGMGDTPAWTEFVGSFERFVGNLPAADSH